MEILTFVSTKKDKAMKLKIGDKIIEEDGIVTIVYTIIKIEGKKATGETEFEGKKYLTAYKTKYFSKNHIRPYIEQKGFNDLTLRRLVD